jgi:hypothetical protein
MMPHRIPNESSLQCSGVHDGIWKHEKGITLYILTLEEYKSDIQWIKFLHLFLRGSFSSIDLESSGQLSSERKLKFNRINSFFDRHAYTNLVNYINLRSIVGCKAAHSMYTIVVELEEKGKIEIKLVTLDPEDYLLLMLPFLYGCAVYMSNIQQAQISYLFFWLSVLTIQRGNVSHRRMTFVCIVIKLAEVVLNVTTNA